MNDGILGVFIVIISFVIMAVLLIGFNADISGMSSLLIVVLWGLIAFVLYAIFGIFFSK